MSVADGPQDGVRLFVNGEPTTLRDPMTIAGLLALLGAEPKGLAIAVDGQVVPRSLWATRTLGANAQVEIVTAAAGG